MTGGSDRFAELRTLLEALCEESITPEQMARLEEVVLADPEAEAFYITFMHLQADLLREFGGALPGLGEERHARESGADGTEAEATRGRTAASEPRPARRPVLRRLWLPWTIAAAACVVSLLAIGFVAWKRPEVVPHWPQPPSLARQDSQRPAGGDRRIVTGGDAVALVIELNGVRWEPADGPPPAEGKVLETRRLRLRSGRAVLAFLSGVTLTLEGPADVDLLAIDRVFCRQGRLRARVPKGAEGFLIASPASAVVDLGTEFALNVEADGRSQVLVIQGAAEVALLDAAGCPQHSQFVRQSKAFDLDPRTGRIAEAVARPERFVPAPARAVPPLVLDPAYAGAVLQARPRGYWRFEALAGGAVPNEIPGGLPLRVSGPVGLSGEGNGCAVFKPGAPEQVLSSDGLWELAHAPGHAVEFWFLADGFRRATLVGLFPPRESNPPELSSRYFHTFMVELTVRERQTLHRPATVRFLHGWPLEIRAETNIYSQGLYVPGRWHHVVAQKAGDRMEIYFDGVPGRSLPIEPDYPSLSCHLVVGRRTPDPHAAHDSRSFVGRLDELAIYDHRLSPEEVRHHFQLATRRARLE